MAWRRETDKISATPISSRAKQERGGDLSVPREERGGE